MVLARGVEPRLLGSQPSRSLPSSIASILKNFSNLRWSREGESNTRMAAYETAAFTAWLSRENWLPLMELNHPRRSQSPPPNRSAKGQNEMALRDGFDPSLSA